MANTEQDRIKEVMPEIDKVSPTFCLAKWHHVTIYLQTGETHSCYHPAPHPIPLEEIRENPSALHNTRHKKQERKQMLEGVQCEGCQYCWNIENMGSDYISDRHIRNSSIYTPERYKEVVKGPWDQNINPEYIEVSFGNECTFKCGYCHPKASSRFWKEIEEHGPYSDSTDHRCDIDWFKVYEEDNNPYIDAWWRWWPEVSQTLNILRITGGEPLIQKNTFRLLNEIDKNPLPQLELNINSNLGIKHALVQKFVTHVQRLLDEGKIKDFKLFCSIDTWDKRNEYTRDGLDIELFEKNLEYYLTNSDLPVTFMITFNLFSVTNFRTLLEKILEWRERFNYADKPERNQFHRLRFDTPYLKEPAVFDMNILPKGEFMPYMWDHLKFIEDNLDDEDRTKFSVIEYEKFRRVVDYMANTHYDERKVNLARKNFFAFFTEYDRRRDKCLLDSFPELENFWSLCEDAYLNGE